MNYQVMIDYKASAGDFKAALFCMWGEAASMQTMTDGEVAIKIMEARS